LAVGLNYTGQRDFPRKEFFWCSSSTFVFAQLPEALSQHETEFNKMQTYFTGEFDRVLISGGADGVKIDEGLILPPKHVTELDRLAWTVRQIENDCQTVPQGAFKMTPLREIRRNEAFEGLYKEEAFCLEKYQHFRAVQQKSKRDQIDRDEAIYNHEFLDDLVSDLPKLAWSIHKDTSETVALLRNQLWPGYFGFHRANTCVHGALYIGYAIKSLDLPFMM
jgi:radial spoke head protein 9